MGELQKQIQAYYPNTVNTLEMIGLIFFVYLLAELVYDWFFNKDKRDFRQSFVDMSVYVGHELATKMVAVIIFIAVLVWFSKFSLTKIPINVWSWVLCILFNDFIYYWTHRLEHRIRLFWTWHSVHHSSHEFQATTALRLSWLEPLVSWYSLLPAVFIGFDPIQVILAFEILLTYQTWIHSRKIPSLGWFEFIFNSPSSHRVHHASNSFYLDKNFGAIFIFWDRIFGTYQQESQPITYGLTKPIQTNNPIKINFQELYRLFKDAFCQKGILGKLLWAFGKLEIPKENQKIQG